MKYECETQQSQIVPMSQRDLLQLLKAEQEHRLLAETLTEVTLALTSTTNYNEVLEEILHQVERIVPYHSANIALVEEDTLHVVHWRGYDLFGGEPFIANFTQPLHQTSISTEVIQTRQPCIVLDTQQDNRWFFAPGIEWVRSYMAVPIQRQQQVIGLLRLSSAQTEGFSERDAQRLQPLANAAAIAITNARLHQQAQQEIAERKQVEQALRQSENRFAMAMTAGRVGVWDWDLGADRGHFEVTLHHVLGYPYSEVPLDQAGLISLVYAEDVSTLYAVLRDYLVGKLRELETTVRIWHKDGTLHWILLRGEVVRNAQSKPLRIMGTLTDITAAKNFEEQLRESEARYRQIFETNQAMKLLIDPEDGRIVDANGAACDFYGYPRHVLTKMSILDINTLPADEVKRIMKDAQVKDLPFLQFHHRLASGEIRDVEVYSGPVHTNNGILLYSIIHDVTARKTAEAHLRQLSQAVEQNPTSIVITNLQGDIEYVNPKFTAVTGYTADEALNQNPRILKTGYTSQAEYENLWQTILQGKVWRGEFQNRAKDGHIYWEHAAISPIKDETGKITHFVANKEDITDLKEMERVLRQRNRELQLLNRAGQALNSTLALDKVLQIMLEEIRRLLDVVACSVWLLDPETKELVCRQVTDPQSDLVRNWHLKLGQGIAGQVALYGKSVIVPDVLQDDRHYKAIDMRTGLQIRSILTVPLRTKQDIIGVFQIVDEQVNRFTANDLALTESLATIAANALENAQLHENLQQQLLTLQNTQAQLIQHEKLAAIGELVAGVAHELNNPLTAVSLYAQLLQRKVTTPDAAQDLRKIKEQILHATSIVRSLLDFSRQHPPERKQTQINDMVTGAFELLAYELRKQNVEWHLQLDPELPLVMVDSRQILQVVVNLVNNAIYAMQENSGQRFLFVMTQVGSSQFAAASATKSPLYVHITIQDNGPGISHDVQPRIFDPFFTTKPSGEGTGLGLSVCHGIVREHEGYIWVRSEPGQGATFLVELPVTIEMDTEEREEETAVSPALAATKARILVIDDEESIREVLCRALRRENYQVDVAADGKTGLTHLQEAAYDLIICDIRMPELTGVDVFKHLQAQHPHLLPRLIFTTGDIINETTRQFLQETRATCLVKPFDLSDLRHLIETTLRK